MDVEGLGRWIDDQPGEDSASPRSGPVTRQRSLQERTSVGQGSPVRRPRRCVRLTQLENLTFDRSIFGPRRTTYGTIGTGDSVIGLHRTVKNGTALRTR